MQRLSGVGSIKLDAICKTKSVLLGSGIGISGPRCSNVALRLTLGLLTSRCIGSCSLHFRHLTPHLQVQSFALVTCSQQTHLMLEKRRFHIGLQVNNIFGTLALSIENAAEWFLVTFMLYELGGIGVCAKLQ